MGCHSAANHEDADLVEGINRQGDKREGEAIARGRDDGGKDP